MMDHDLFDAYPNHPGAKARNTSFEAADEAAKVAPTLRAKCLAVLGDGPMTADECAAKLARDILSVRPRFSELARMGKVRDTGDRRPNASGKKAIIWRLAGD